MKRALLTAILLIFLAWAAAEPAYALSPAQRRLLAERGAEVVAYRNLARAAGEARQYGRDAGNYTESVRATIRGARVVELRRNADGSVTAIVEIIGPDNESIRAAGTARPPER